MTQKEERSDSNIEIVSKKYLIRYYLPLSGQDCPNDTNQSWRIIL